jgi:hypothetical protein
MEYDLGKKPMDCTSAVAFLVAGAKKQGASEEAPLSSIQFLVRLNRRCCHHPPRQR